MYKKILTIFMSIILITTPIFATESKEFIWINECVETATKVDKLEIHSRCAVAYDRASRTVVWGKNENQKVPMASTTKIMTAIILVENVDDLTEQVKVVKEAAMVGGSSLHLKTGDKLTYEALLYGLLLCSGNDAAMQIAISVGGSKEGFAELMNEKADEMLLENTHFVTPHGLDMEGHYTTAYELAKIADYALGIEEIAKVVSTKRYTIVINGYQKELSNTNELLGTLDGVNGVKTGFTNGAGRCLVTSVKRNNFEIITVVLGADTKKIRTKDSINIIEYIYKNYTLIDIDKIVAKEWNSWNEINERRIMVVKGKDATIKAELETLPYKKCLVKKDEQDKIKCIAKCDKYSFEAPVPKKTQVGNIEILINNKTLLTLKIYTMENIKRKTIWDYMIEMYFYILSPGAD